MTKITFHGAARTVTGSKYLLEAAGVRVLIDCGLFQGIKKLRQRNWEPTPFDIDRLDAVVLTHAHLDHTGYLPRIIKEGYHQPVYCTPATSALAEIILLDSAKCQENDAHYANRKGFSKHKPALPLYDGHDVEQTINLKGPAVIIASSGMMTGGRIVHHLKQRLPQTNNTIVLGGYMALGTRGRHLQDGAKTIRIHGANIPAQAAIETVPGLSGHADRSDLLRWLGPLPKPRKVFLTHGEPRSADALADQLHKERGWDILCPELGETVELV